MKILSFDFSTVVFWYFGICFLIILQLCLAVRQLFFDRAAVVLCSPTHTVGRFSTAQLFGSCVLLVRQLSFVNSAVVLGLGNCFFIVRQLFFDFWQLCFDLSAVVICWVGSYFLPVRLLFFVGSTRSWDMKQKKVVIFFQFTPWIFKSCKFWISWNFQLY